LPPDVPLLPVGKLAWRDDLARRFRQAWVGRSFPDASWAQRWELEADLFPEPTGAGRPVARWAAFEGYIASLLCMCAFTVSEVNAVFRELGWAATQEDKNGLRAMRRLRKRRREALEALQVETRKVGGVPPILPQPSDGQIRSAERRRKELSDLRLHNRRGDPDGFLCVTRTTDHAGESRAASVAVARGVARISDFALHPMIADWLARSPTFRRRCVEAEIIRLRALKNFRLVDDEGVEQ
jgi:hypothetical protein